MEIPKPLVQAIARDDAVLFIGAGLSMGAGLPSWNQLLTPLADEIGLEGDERDDLLQVALDYELERGRQPLIDHILEKTKTTHTGPTDNHRRLADLGIDTWVTTNYDDLLELTLRDAGKDYVKVVLDQNLSYTRTDRVTLTKLHGDRLLPDSIVITERDYNTYFRESPRIQQDLNALLARKTLLFVGYSVSDPDFKQILDGVAYDLGRHQRRSYAVLFDADEREIRRLESRNIHALNIEMEKGDDPSERLGRSWTS
jgi:hypothetical protein